MSDTMTHAEAEAALCVWEDLLDRFHYRSHRAASDELLQYWANYGTSAVRMNALSLGPEIEALWRRYDNEFPEKVDTCFDWEIVPALLDVCHYTSQSIAAPSYEEAKAALDKLAT